MKMISIEIPYDGCYGSTLDGLIEVAIECEMDYHNLDYDDLNIPYGDVWKAIAIEWTEQIAHKLGIKLVFKELLRPREYNFTDDRIFAEISQADFEKVKSLVTLEQLTKSYTDRFKPREGFMPFSRYWPMPALSNVSDVSEWDENQLYCFLDAVLEDDPFDPYEMEEFISNLVCEHIPYIEEDEA